MNFLNLLIIGALIYLIFKMNKQSCGMNKGVKEVKVQEKFENNYPIVNDMPLRDKLKKELVPQLQNLRTGFDTVFDSINNYLDMKKISERVGCTKREQELIDTGAIDPYALQNTLKNLVDTKKAEYKSRVDEMVRQVEQMVIQY